MEYLLSGSSHEFPTWKFQATWNWEALAHFLQLNGFSPVWVLSCFFKWPAIEKFLSHFEHLKGFSRLWVLSCSFKWPAIEKLYCSLVALWTFERLLSCLGPLTSSIWKASPLYGSTHAPSRNLMLKTLVTLCALATLEYLLSGSSHWFSSNLM